MHQVTGPNTTNLLMTKNKTRTVADFDNSTNIFRVEKILGMYSGKKEPSTYFPKKDHGQLTLRKTSSTFPKIENYQNKSQHLDYVKYVTKKNSSPPQRSNKVYSSSPHIRMFREWKIAKQRSNLCLMKMGHIVRPLSHGKCSFLFCFFFAPYGVCFTVWSHCRRSDTVRRRMDAPRRQLLSLRGVQTARRRFQNALQRPKRSLGQHRRRSRTGLRAQFDQVRTCVYISTSW